MQEDENDSSNHSIDFSNTDLQFALDPLQSRKCLNGCTLGDPLISIGLIPTFRIELEPSSSIDLPEDENQESNSYDPSNEAECAATGNYGTTESESGAKANNYCCEEFVAQSINDVREQRPSSISKDQIDSEISVVGVTNEQQEIPVTVTCQENLHPNPTTEYTDEETVISNTISKRLPSYDDLVNHVSSKKGKFEVEKLNTSNKKVTTRDETSEPVDQCIDPVHQIIDIDESSDDSDVEIIFCDGNVQDSIKNCKSKSWDAKPVLGDPLALDSFAIVKSHKSKNDGDSKTKVIAEEVLDLDIIDDETCIEKQETIEESKSESCDEKPSLRDPSEYDHVVDSNRSENDGDPKTKVKGEEVPPIEIILSDEEPEVVDSLSDSLHIKNSPHIIDLSDSEIDTDSDGELEEVDEDGGDHTDNDVPGFNSNQSLLDSSHKIPPIDGARSYREILAGLNTEQRMFVSQILHNFRTETTPFYYFLSGAPGTGKSETVRAIGHMVTRLFNDTSTLPHSFNKVLILAPTEETAHLIGGTTISNALALPSFPITDAVPELPEETAKVISENLRYVQLIVIDEISTVGKVTMSAINSRLKGIFGNEMDFGGKPVVLVGDFDKLPPVKDTPLFKPQVGTIDTESVTSLWENFKPFKLEEMMRQKDDENLIETLEHFARGKLNDTDLALLNTRNYEGRETELPSDAVLLLPFKEDVHFHNESLLHAKPGKACNVIALDKVIQSTLSKCEENTFLSSLASKKDLCHLQPPHTLTLKIDGRYQLTKDIAPKIGLVKYATGTLVSVLKLPSGALILILRFEKNVIGKQASNEHRENAVKSKRMFLALIKTAKEIISTSLVTIERIQFPIKPAEAMSIRDLQGETCQNVCICLNSQINWAWNYLYVALTRVRSVENLYLLGKFRHSHCKKRRRRIKTETVFKLPLYEKHLKTWSTIFYLHVDSAQNGMEEIISDPFFGVHEVIILVEKVRQIVEVPSAILSQYNAHACHLPNGETLFKVLYLSKEFGEIVFSIDLIACGKALLLHLFRINNLFILTGYRSPGFNPLKFRSSLGAALDKVCKGCPLVFIGDFNCSEDGELDKLRLSIILDKYGVDCVLPSKIENSDSIDSQVFRNCGNGSGIICVNTPSNAQNYWTYFPNQASLYVQIPSKFAAPGFVGPLIEPAEPSEGIQPT